MPGGMFTDHVFTTMKERDILRFEGPLGTFFLREDSDKPMVLLASGTGFAPIKALIEQCIHSASRARPMTLYWGGRRPQRPVHARTCASNGRASCRISSTCRWFPTPRRRMAGTAAAASSIAPCMADMPDLSGHQVYACGAPVMVDAAKTDFAAAGLPAEEFFADAFTSAADLMT